MSPTNSSPESAHRAAVAQGALLGGDGLKQADFILALSHELRSPLNAVIGLSDALLESEAPFDSVRTAKYLRLIHSSGHRLLAQLNDVFDIARFDTGRFTHSPQLVDLRKICGGLFDAIKAETAGKNLHLHLPPADPVLLEADERLLRRALQPIITRAAKVTPAGGHINLTITRVAGNVEVAVADSGASAGTALESLLRQTGAGKDISQFGSIELGLVLADCIARQHAGCLSVQGHSPAGTVIALHLPAPASP